MRKRDKKLTKMDRFFSKKRIETKYRMRAFDFGLG